MAIPEYILNAAREYCSIYDGDESIYNAFIAGFKASRQIKAKNVSLTQESTEVFESCWLAYNRKGSKAKAKIEWTKLTEEECDKVLPHIKSYVSTRERCYQKDFERYLRDKTFNEVVVRGDTVVYDPERMNTQGEYRPLVDGFSSWFNQDEKCLYFNGHIEQIADGYNESNRPDGALAACGMYRWRWNASQRQWIIK